MFKANHEFLLWGIGLILISLYSCRVQEKKAPASDAIQPLQQMAVINQIPDKLFLNGDTLELNVYLWRDFQPISPPEGKPLRIVVKVRDTQGKPLPPDIKLKKVKVLYQDQSWETTLKEMPRPSGTVSEISATAGGGPKLPPDSLVDVIVFLEDGHGKIHRLKALKQRIEKTF